MDLLFSKYASPFVLLEQMILNGRLLEFVNEFVELNDEKEMYNFWIHRVFDKTFDEFKNGIRKNNNVYDVNVETTLTDSKNILNGFVPHD